MTTLHLLRHGETLWNADGRFQGIRDIPLNEAGRQQAQAVAGTLRARRIGALYCSDLARAAETATIVGGVLGIRPVPDPRLREADFGEWEGLTLPEIRERWPEHAARWGEDPVRLSPPGGEPLNAMQARVTASLRDIVAAHPGGTVLVVTHGGSIRAAVATALGTDLSLFRRVRLDNASLTTIHARDAERWTLAGLNDTCALEAGGLDPVNP